MVKKGFIDKTKSGKDVFYELQEPLMRICFEINENPDGIAKLFVDFLKVIYEPVELRKNYLLYWFGAKYQEGESKKMYNQEAKAYGKVLEDQGVYLSPKEVKNLNDSSIKKFTTTLLTQFKKANQLNQFYDAFPATIFNTLNNIENYEKEKLQSIQNHLNETFANIDKMKISLLMLNVGIRYLAEGDKRALFDLSKEERKVFTDFVLTPREERNK